jgi:hypothetical protein
VAVGEQVRSLLFLKAPASPTKSTTPQLSVFFFFFFFFFAFFFLPPKSKKMSTSNSSTGEPPADSGTRTCDSSASDQSTCPCCVNNVCSDSGACTNTVNWFLYAAFFGVLCVAVIVFFHIRRKRLRRREQLKQVEALRAAPQRLGPMPQGAPGGYQPQGPMSGGYPPPPPQGQMPPPYLANGYAVGFFFFFFFFFFSFFLAQE